MTAMQLQLHLRCAYVPQTQMAKFCFFMWRESGRPQHYSAHLCDVATQHSLQALARITDSRPIRT